MPGISRTPKVACVIDALSAYRGAEKVLAAVLEMYPDAPIYTLVHDRRAFEGTPIEGHPVYTSAVQHLPGGKAHYRSYLPVLPLAVEKLDLRGYDIVLSFSYAVAHGVQCRPDQLHISYTFAPLRYAWQNAHEYFQHGIASPIANLIMHYFRLWDRGAAGAVDHMVAISQWTASCIWRAYRREAEVIYPPVQIEQFTPLRPRGDYFVAFARLVRHKRLDLIVEAISRLGLPLMVIGEGPERRRLEELAAPNVKLLGSKSNQEAAELLGRARALIHAAEEDFGLVMAEAQAAGCPVIAYGAGAAPEIVLDGKTGVLFADASVESLMEAVQCFVRDEDRFKSEDCVSNAQRFSKPRFQKAFADMVDREWKKFSAGSDGGRLQG